MKGAREMSASKDDKNFRVTNNNAVDVHVGKRIRLRRTLLGMSQDCLLYTSPSPRD